jgi:predicted Zn-ribbon and HTH transcriptional regulator
MLRTDLKNYLIGDGMSLNQLSRLVRKPVSELENDLKHLEKSLKHQGGKIETEPAHCRKCQFDFLNRNGTNLPLP